LLAVLAGVGTGSAYFQQSSGSSTQSKPPINVEVLVNEWLKRLNALADWTTGGPGTRVDRMVELYDPSGLLFVGPNENQIGPVTYSGIEGIRHWADNFAHTYLKSEFRIQVETEKVKTAGLIHTVAPPWGGTSIAFQMSAFYTLRENQKKFAAPGAAFLEFTEGGKIRRTRIYLETNETVEITQ
jgi:hypothetical protein